MAGGRPTQGSEAKRAPLNMKTSPSLRRSLEVAAGKTGRPLTQEVEARLERTFAEDAIRGGAHNAAFFHLAVASAVQIETRNGSGWHEDIETFWAVKAAVNRLLDLNRPKASSDLVAAQDAFEKAVRERSPANNYVTQLLAMNAETKGRRAARDDVSDAVSQAVAHEMRYVDAALERLMTLAPSAETKEDREREGAEIAHDQHSRFYGPKLKG